jgi:hypothetical protein
MIAQAIDSPSHVPDGRRAVLLLGDSRVSEGFSARIADELGKPGWTGTIVNSAVARSHPPAARFSSAARSVRKLRTSGDTDVSRSAAFMRAR